MSKKVHGAGARGGFGTPAADRSATPEKLLEVRLRIAAGFYDRPGVRAITAERILDAGDVMADI